MKYLAAVFALLVLAVPVRAEGEPLRVALHGPTPEVTARLATALDEVLDTDVRLVDESADADLVVALGDTAFRAATGRGIPVIGLRLAPELVAGLLPAVCNCSAVPAHASALDQLRLIRRLLPGARRVGLLYRGRMPYGESLAEQARQLGLLLVPVDARNRPPAVTLAELMPRVDVLLALPDPGLYNAETARAILMTSYRQNRPVVGPDEHWVKAGSLATARVDEAAQLAALVAMIDHYRATGALPPPPAPGAGALVNPHVAEAFLVPVPAGADVETLEVEP